MHKLCKLFSFEAKDNVPLVIHYICVNPSEKPCIPLFMPTVEVQLVLCYEANGTEAFCDL